MWRVVRAAPLGARGTGKFQRQDVAEAVMPGAMVLVTLPERKVTRAAGAARNQDMDVIPLRRRHDPLRAEGGETSQRGVESPPHVMPAVDREVRAGDPRGLVVEEEGDGVGDLVGLAEAADGDLRDDLGAYVLGDRHHHVGADVAGRDGVDGDAQLGIFLRE